MIRFVQGDIFESQADALVNPVNCAGVSGKGLAKEFKERFPIQVMHYEDWCEHGVVEPGQVYWWMPREERAKTVIFFTTKQHWKDPSQMLWIHVGLKSLRFKLSVSQPITFRSVAFPALGCGNGGLNWSAVKPLFPHHLRDLDCDIEVYEPQP